jgi:hypothetical protein
MNASKQKAITLSEISVDSVGRAINDLSKAFNNNADKISVIQTSIMVGYEQGGFDVTGNAFCQKAAALASAVAKFSPDRAKKVVAFFKGKIPFSIVSNGEGEYKLSKLNWDLVKDDEEKANEMLEVAVNAWVPKSKSIIKEVVVE